MIVKLLKDWFGNLQQIIKAHIKGLLKMPNCGNDHPSSLCTMYDRLIVHVRGLEILGITSEQYRSTCNNDQVS